jgi:uncharacterized protein (DUF488 family)
MVTAVGMTELWTIGHSTRAWENFLALLRAHHIQALADVRLMPASRRNPQFNAAALARNLAQAGIAYLACRELGGRRKARPDSGNQGWRNASFRGYADYMETAPFREAMDLLLAPAATARTAILCAEAVPWRCHRSLIADTLLCRGWTVRHILAPDRADFHQPPPFAVIRPGLVTYPAPLFSDLNRQV